MTRYRYKITGPGMIRAVQESVDKQMDLEFIHEDDNAGHLVRVGYFLIEKGKPVPKKPLITWFKPNEIEISFDFNQDNKYQQAVLGASFIHPRGNERHFLINLPFDDHNRFMLRNLFRIKNKSIIGFMIQVEILIYKGNKDNFIPIVRYDQSHGFIHRDMISSDGNKTKTKIKTQDAKTAIIFAVDEIRDNLDTWFRQLGYLTSGQKSLNHPDVIREMDKAKLKLLELYNNPASIINTESSYFNLHDGSNDQLNLET